MIQVKGKGDMMTCYVLGRKISRNLFFGKTVNAGNNSLAEVVYGMVRARKRRTARKGSGVVFRGPQDSFACEFYLSHPPNQETEHDHFFTLLLPYLKPPSRALYSLCS